MKKSNLLARKCYEKNHVNFIATLLILIINAFLLIIVAVFLQKILDIAVSGTKEDLKRILSISFCYMLALGIEGIASRKLRNRFVEKAMKQLKEAVFEGITEKSIIAFKEESVGRYISILTNDMISIENNYLQNNFNILLNILLFVSALALMFAYNVTLTICSISLVMVSVMTSVRFSGHLAKEEKKVSQSNENFVRLVKDFLSGFTVIKSFRAEKEITKIFCIENRDLEKQKCRRRKTEDGISLVGLVFGFGVQAGVMMIGAYLILQGKITAGVLIAFVQLMNYIIQPIQQIPAALANRKAALSLLDKMLQATEQKEDMDCGEDITDIGSGICLKDVSFGYTENQIVLQNVNVNFEQGKSYAIVGTSGSGKSTLLNLLMGGYDNYHGQILFGSQELRNISRKCLYHIISQVEQNVFIFDSTIQNNITMFKVSDAQKISDIIHKVNLEELIMERGMDYLCGENGNGLSGGEKQRISIARSLFHDASVLLLDEATSALDPATSAKLEDMITSMRDITRIVITHKLDAEVLKRYDQILVMKNGSILAIGSFDELEKNCLYFRQLKQQ